MSTATETITRHLTSGRRYQGAVEVTRISPAADEPNVVAHGSNLDEWVAVRFLLAGGTEAMQIVRADDVHETADAARATVRARKAAR